jgi:uncharacterized protein with GYD domain
MKRFFTLGRLTQAYAKGIVAAPEDRGPALRKLVEAAGAKLVEFYFVTGDYDFLMVTEAEEIEKIVPVLLAVGAAGTVSDLKTFTGWTPAEFKSIAASAAAVATAYKAPG